MQKPSIGRVVHVCLNNRRVPAMVNHVWSDTQVNVTLLDGTNQVLASVQYHAEDELSATHVNFMHTVDRTWAWPPRV